MTCQLFHSAPYEENLIFFFISVLQHLLLKKWQSAKGMFHGGLVCCEFSCTDVYCVIRPPYCYCHTVLTVSVQIEPWVQYLYSRTEWRWRKTLIYRSLYIQWPHERNSTMLAFEAVSLNHSMTFNIPNAWTNLFYADAFRGKMKNFISDLFCIAIITLCSSYDPVSESLVTLNC